MKFDPTKELSDLEALRIINDILDSGNIIYSKHAKKQMMTRGYDIFDVTFILSKGVIDSKKFDDEHQNWVYRIKGYDIDGDAGAVVTAIISQRQLEIITVLS